MGVFVCVLMDRQMGQSRRTVDEGFKLQLALSPPLCSKHTLTDTKGVDWHCLCVFVRVVGCWCGSCPGIRWAALILHEEGTAAVISKHTPTLDTKS